MSKLRLLGSASYTVVTNSNSTSVLIDINNRVTTEIAVALGPGPRISQRPATDFRGRLVVYSITLNVDGELRNLNEVK